MQLILIIKSKDSIPDRFKGKVCSALGDRQKETDNKAAAKKQQQPRKLFHAWAPNS